MKKYIVFFLFTIIAKTSFAWDLDNARKHIKEAIKIIEDNKIDCNSNNITMKKKCETFHYKLFLAEQICDNILKTRLRKDILLIKKDIYRLKQNYKELSKIYKKLLKEPDNSNEESFEYNKELCLLSKKIHYCTRARSFAIQRREDSDSEVVDRDKNAEILFIEANLLKKQDNYIKALKKYKQIMEQGIDENVELLSSAQLEAAFLSKNEIKNYPEAKNFFELYLKKNTDQKEVLISYINVLKKMNEYKLLYNIITENEQNLDDVDLFLSLGDFFHVEKKFEEALFCYEKALELNPKDEYNVATNKINKTKEEIISRDKSFINCSSSNIGAGNNNSTNPVKFILDIVF